MFLFVYSLEVVEGVLVVVREKSNFDLRFLKILESKCDCQGQLVSIFGLDKGQLSGVFWLSCGVF